MDRKLEPNTSSQIIENVSKLVNKSREAGILVVLVHVSSIDGKDMLHLIADSDNQLLSLFSLTSTALGIIRSLILK